ncbi:MAG: 5-oxoprolinase subunit PxpB [Bacteroidetes bacterium]|nr:5-oxoprolinase subunit PxpB [Bacteroidota bacterium]
MIQIIPSGDSAFLVKLGDEISEHTNKMVRSFQLNVESKAIEGIIELIPAYCDVLVLYDPLIISYEKLYVLLEKTLSKLSSIDVPDSRLIEIPVCYEDEFAENMEDVMEHTKLSKEEIIRIHSSQTYLVYMLGFTPGFCYLGGMDEKISTPRKAVPSQNIKAGSVGIAGKQTGIYPIDSPGGWQIIGRTPIKLFDPDGETQFLCKAGDRLKFTPIDSKEFNMIRVKQE